MRHLKMATNRFTRAWLYGCVITLLARPHAVSAFQSTGIPIRSVSILAHGDSGVFASITDVRRLPDGRVLVNDRVKRQVLLIDTLLSTPAIVFGSAPNVEGRYTTPTRLLAYGPDSTVFVNRDGQSLVVVGPNARVVRVMAAPKTTDLPLLGNPTFGTAGFDLEGRL